MIAKKQGSKNPGKKQEEKRASVHASWPDPRSREEISHAEDAVNAADEFAASFGWGVAASALTVLVVQGAITGLGAALGDVLPDAQLAAITAAGGLMLVGVALRLLRIREIAVADLLPGLLVAPLLVGLVAAFR